MIHCDEIVMFIQQNENTKVSGATNEYVYGIDRLQQWTVIPLGR